MALHTFCGATRTCSEWWQQIMRSSVVVDMMVWAICAAKGQRELATTHATMSTVLKKVPQKWCMIPRTRTKKIESSLAVRQKKAASVTACLSAKNSTIHSRQVILELNSIAMSGQWCLSNEMISKREKSGTVFAALLKMRIAVSTRTQPFEYLQAFYETDFLAGGGPKLLQFIQRKNKN